jgi:hypothetical protein
MDHGEAQEGRSLCRPVPFEDGPWRAPRDD